jgi:two-component sensor histidine kinase
LSESIKSRPPDGAWSPTPALFARVFEASPGPMLLLAADAPRFTMLAVNKAHAGAFRTTPDALRGRGLFEVFPDPPDARTRAFMETVRASFERVLETRRPDEMPIQPYAVEGPGGEPEERFWGATQTPLFGAGGEISHILSTIRDVTAEVAERRINEARALLMREVDHRARNALTVVQSIVRLTEAESQKTFKHVVQGRVEALARAQTSLARRKWEGALLRDVVEAELAALAAPGAFTLAGPRVLLPPEQVQATSMILHELATNAHKYGALSVPGGAVSVVWTAADGQLGLTWTETGGPPAAAPRKAGFGSRLITRLVRQLRGELSYDWRAEGLRAELTAPL